MEDDARLALRVGAVMLALIGVASMLLLRGNDIFLGRLLSIDVHFERVTGLQAGAPVKVAGREIGTVMSISIVPPHETNALISAEHDSSVVARLRIRARYRTWARKNSEFFIGGQGLLSSRYLEIGPSTDGSAPDAPIENGDRFRGTDPPNIDRAVYRTLSNMQVTRKFAKAVGPDARALRDAVRKLQRTTADIEPTPGAYAILDDNLSKLSAEVDRLKAHVDYGNSEGLGHVIDESHKLLEKLRGISSLLRPDTESLLIGLRQARLTVGRMPESSFRRMRSDLDHARASAEHAVATARFLVDYVRDGRGTIGGLMRDPEFSDDTKKLGKLLKRKPWLLLGGHNNKPHYGRPPEPPKP